MDNMQLATSSVPLQRKSTGNILTDVLITQINESGQMITYLKMEMRKIVKSALLVDSIVRNIMAQIIFIMPVAPFVKNTAHDRFPAMSVQARF